MCHRWRHDCPGMHTCPLCFLHLAWDLGPGASALCCSAFPEAPSRKSRCMHASVVSFTAAMRAGTLSASMCFCAAACGAFDSSPRAMQVSRGTHIFLLPAQKYGSVGDLSEIPCAALFHCPAMPCSSVLSRRLQCQLCSWFLP